MDPNVFDSYLLVIYRNCKLQLSYKNKENERHLWNNVIATWISVGKAIPQHKLANHIFSKLIVITHEGKSIKSNYYVY